MKKVLVIVVTYNGKQWIDSCLQSVKQSNYKLDCLVVDNCSVDGSQQLILENHPDVNFIQSDANLGFGRANNIGIKYAVEHGYDYVYLLNQDAMICPDTIEKLLGIFDSHSEYGLLSPIQIQANKSHFDSNFGISVIQSSSNIKILEDYYFNKVLDVYPVEDVLAANWFIKRECFIQVGGFSHSFPHYGEDNNYCQRCLYHSFKIGIVPSARAIHDTESRIVEPIPKQIHQQYMLSISMLSNIYNPKTFVVLRTILISLKNAYIYKSIKPIVNELKLLSKLRFYKNNAKLTKGRSAFLN